MSVMFGVHYGPEGLTFNQVREVCLAAEEQGYDTFTLIDHLYPMRPSSLGYPLECWSTLAGLAAITRKIKIGSLVSCVLYRNPTLLGKIATTVDIISDGRLILGIGAGWHEAEFKAYFNRFPPDMERLNVLEEAAQILRGMLHGQETTFIGKLYHVENLINLPRPIQKHIPIMIGGGGEKRTLRIAAKYADISHFGGDTLEEYERKIRVLKEHCRMIGRDFAEITLAQNITPTFENGRFSAEFMGKIESWIKLGTKMFMVRFFALKEKPIEMQRRFAKEVLPSFKS